MPDDIPLTPADSVEILTLMDNSSDLLLRTEDRAKRPTFADGARVEAPVMLDASLPRYLTAEHGFSALVSVTSGGRTRRLMFDAGLSVASGGDDGGAAVRDRVLRCGEPAGCGGVCGVGAGRL
jgi:hypothetical protein